MQLNTDKCMSLGLTVWIAKVAQILPVVSY